MNRFISPILILPMFTLAVGGPSTFAFADDPAPKTFAETIRNTKEGESILLKSERSTSRSSSVNTDEEVTSEDRVYFPIENRSARALALNAFATTANEMEKQQYCEPLLLNLFQTNLKNLGLPSEAPAVREALLLARASHLIDDVTLLPLLATFPAWKSVGYRPSEWTKSGPQGQTIHVACATDQFLGVVGAVRSEKGKKAKRKNIREQIAKMKSGTAPTPKAHTQWLEALNEARYDEATPYSLSRVIKVMQLTTGTSSRAIPNDVRTKIMSKRKKKSGGLSNRITLFAQYDDYQINALSDLFKTFTERSGVATVTKEDGEVVLLSNAEVRIHFQDGREDEVYTLTPNEQYNMAAKMLHKNLTELKLDSNFDGKSPTFDDVIIAGIETGYIHGDEINAALGADDIWNAPVSGWQKTLNFIKRYGSTALILIPGGVGIWAPLAITLVETFTTKKSAGNADDRGISIF